MQLIYGDMFNMLSYVVANGDKIIFNPDALVITTNGFVKSNGEAVMGRGCAKKAATIFPTLPILLGRGLGRLGNHAHIIVVNDAMTFVSFPVKPVDAVCNKDKSNVVFHMRNKFCYGDTVPGWACKADLKLIEQSAGELRELADMRCWSHVVLPRPGCGAGELDWIDVKPILVMYLDNRFYCIDFTRPVAS